MNFDNCRQLLQNVYERFYEHMTEGTGEGYFESRPHIADDFIKLRYYVFPFALEKKHEQVFGNENALF